MTGKGDSGAHAALPKSLSIAVHALVVPWMIFTIVVYGMILVGGFVKTWGLDNTLNNRALCSGLLRQRQQRFDCLDGVAWNSFWTTNGNRFDFRPAHCRRRIADSLYQSSGRSLPAAIFSSLP